MMSWLFLLSCVRSVKNLIHLIYKTSTNLGPFLWLFANIWRHQYDVITFSASYYGEIFLIFKKKSELWKQIILLLKQTQSWMTKQNAEIRQILQNGCHIFRVIYFLKMSIKVSQIHTVSFDMHAFSAIAISRLYMKYDKRYRSWQPLNMVIFLQF